VLVLQGTNPTLRPETATTWTGGLDLAPSILTGLRLSWTYYSIAYQGQIITPTLDDPADVLLHITRNPSGVLVDWICNSPEFNSSRAACLASSPTAIVDLRLANLGLTHMSGLDMNVREQLETRLGGFDLKALGSRVFSLTQSATSTSPTVDILDTVGNAISLRLRATAAWSQHIGNDTGFGAEVGVNYTGPYRNPASRLVPNVRSWTTFDLKLRYRTPSTGWWSGIELALTAVNLFDEPPPFVDDVYGYDVANVQPLGRVIGLNFSKRW
jgi:iron complex outermembrane receptor protein